MTLQLSERPPFARGGNRLCFVAPGDRGRCIKVRRPDFTLADRRRKKGFPGNLRPLSWFDDNREEYRVMTALWRRHPAVLGAHLPRCFGFVDTDLGPGLITELIRDGDGAISQTLKKILWDEGLTPPCRRAVAALGRFWIEHGIPSRDLLLHNIVAQRGEDGVVRRLVVIDGLGRAGLRGTRRSPAAARRKVSNLQRRIEDLLALRGGGAFPGYHGLLFHNDAPGGP